MKNDVEVLVSTVEGAIHCIGRNNRSQICQHDCAMNFMRVSPNGKQIACYDEKGNLILANKNFSGELLGKYLFKSNTRLQDLQWCDKDTVLLLLFSHILFFLFFIFCFFFFVFFCFFFVFVSWFSVFCCFLFGFVSNPSFLLVQALKGLPKNTMANYSVG